MKQNSIDKEAQRLGEIIVHPGDQKIEAMLGQSMNREYRLIELLKRPNVHIEPLLKASGLVLSSAVVNEQIEIDCKYEGYISRQQEEIDRVSAQQETGIPENIDYKEIRGLSNEVCQKLEEVRPVTIGQAGRISGVTPAAVSLLLVYLKKRNRLVRPGREAVHSAGSVKLA